MSLLNILPELREYILILALDYVSIGTVLVSLQTVKLISKDILAIFRKWFVWKCIFNRLGYKISLKSNSVPKDRFNPIDMIFTKHEVGSLDFFGWGDEIITRADSNTMNTNVLGTNNYLLYGQQNKYTLYHKSLKKGYNIGIINASTDKVLEIRETCIGLVIAVERDNNIDVYLFRKKKLVQIMNIDGNYAMTYYGVYIDNTLHRWKRKGDNIHITKKMNGHILVNSSDLYTEGVGSTNLDIINAQCGDDQTTIVVYDFDKSEMLWMYNCDHFDESTSIDTLISIDDAIHDAYTGKQLFNVGYIHKVSKKKDRSGYDVWFDTVPIESV